MNQYSIRTSFRKCRRWVLLSLRLAGGFVRNLLCKTKSDFTLYKLIQFASTSSYFDHQIPHKALAVTMKV